MKNILNIFSTEVDFHVLESGTLSDYVFKDMSFVLLLLFKMSVKLTKFD